MPLRSLALLLLAVTTAHAQPGPGDVYREFLWTGPYVNSSNWQRVTDPEARHSGAAAFLPNPVNHIELSHLEGALRAEVTLEQWGGHAGTSAKRLRVNGGDWIEIPEPAGIPGNAGAGIEARAECWQYFAYPTLAVPLEALRAGDNTFELTCGPQVCHDFGWGQWGFYAAIVRLYYPPATAAVSGRVELPEGNVVRDERLPLDLRLEGDVASVTGVDWIGSYEDFDVRGDSSWRGWQATTRFGRLAQHIGSAASAPWTATWATDWVPDQDQPAAVAARIRTADGLLRWTEAVEGITWERPDRSVRLYKPFDVPTGWQTRVGRRQGNNLFVPHDLAAARRAQITLATWSGGHADAIEVNGAAVAERVGRVHDYSLDTVDVPVDRLQPGLNHLSTYAETEHHGIEVLWPGIALKVAYDGRIPEATAPTADHILHGAGAGPDAIPPEASFLELAPSDGDTTLEATARIPSWRLVFPAPAGGLSGYRALRLSLRIDEARGDEAGLWVQVLGGRVDLRAEAAPWRVDLDSQAWQTVDVPLSAFDRPADVVDAVTLGGTFAGRFRVGQVRLVAGAETAVTEPTGSGPAGFALAPAYPNPFNGATTVAFDLPQAAQVRVSVYGLTGQRLLSLTEGLRPAGRHTVTWDGRDAAGRAAATGVYFLRLESARQSTARRVLLLR